MKTVNKTMKVGALAVAVQGALLALAGQTAQAQEAAATPLRQAEIGLIEVSKASGKFGEYNGLDRSGASVNGGFDLRGGNGYGDPAGTTRWQIYGKDLGLSSREAGASFSNQGKWSLGLTYDSLRHVTSDTYQTPYQGSVGGNSFTLPAGFPLVPNTRTMTAAQISAFQTEKIYNDRENYGLNGSFIINPQTSFKFDFNRLEQSGAKLQGFGSAQFAVAGAPNGERIAILPMPTNYRTDQLNASLNWVGENAYLTGGYYGSFFRDKYNGVNFQTFAGAVVTETMGTAPSNDLHQLNLTGGYAFSKRTKLTGGLSYGRNTQNMDFAYDTAAMITPSPTTSLNGLVVTKHADVKLTDQTTKDLILSAGFKYDDRDNRTSSNIYNFRSIDGGNIANYPNAPLSIKKTQLELAGDYRLTAKQKVRLAYSHDTTDRKCSNYATGGGTPAYAPGTNCVTVPHTKEDKIGVTYRVRAMDSLGLNAGYTYSNRRSDRDLNARAPMIGRDGNPTAAGIAAAPPGITGLNAGEFIGFNPFFEASRRQNAFKAGANWDATEQLSFGLNGRLTDDDYGTTYGMQKGHSWSVNLDGNYRYAENGTVMAFVTQQERTREMNNDQRSPLSAAVAATATAVAIPSGATWTNKLKDQDTTFGLGMKHDGLLGGKFGIAGDLSYTYTKTNFSTSLDYSTTTTGGLTCADPSIFTCVPLPDITSRLFMLRLNGTYDVSKTAKVRVGYIHQRLSSEDFYYNGLQTGFTPTSVLPTNQTAPNYTVNVVFGSVILNF